VDSGTTLFEEERGRGEGGRGGGGSASFPVKGNWAVKEKKKKLRAKGFGKTFQREMNYNNRGGRGLLVRRGGQKPLI